MAPPYGSDEVLEISGRRETGWYDGNEVLEISDTASSRETGWYDGNGLPLDTAGATGTGGGATYLNIRSIEPWILSIILSVGIIPSFHSASSSFPNTLRDEGGIRLNLSAPAANDAIS